MAFIGRLPKPLPRAWASAMKADRHGAVPAPRTSEEIMACPRTSDATRAWIKRMEEKDAARKPLRRRIYT